MTNVLMSIATLSAFFNVRFTLCCLILLFAILICAYACRFFGLFRSNFACTIIVKWWFRLVHELQHTFFFASCTHAMLYSQMDWYPVVVSMFFRWCSFGKFMPDFWVSFVVLFLRLGEADVIVVVTLSFVFTNSSLLVSCIITWQIYYVTSTAIR